MKKNFLIAIALALEVLFLIILIILFYNSIKIKAFILIVLAIPFFLITLNKPWIFIYLIPLSAFVSFSVEVAGMEINAGHLLIFLILFFTLPYCFIKSQNCFRKSLFQKALLALVIVSIFSFLFANLRNISSPWVMRGTLEMILLFILYQICILLVDSKEKVQYLKFALIIAGMFLAIKTLSTYSLALRFSAEKMAKMLYFIRGGTFGGSPNQAAMFIELIAPIVLVYYLYAKRLLWKALSLCLFFIMFFAVISTFSRAGIFSLLFVSGVIIIFTKKYREALLPISVILFVLLISSFYLLVLARFESFALQSSTFAGRLPLFKSAINIIKENWLFGIGMNNFSLLKYNYGFPSFLDPIRIQSAHNIYLEMFANLGIFGLVSAIVILVISFVAIRRIRSDNERNGENSIAFFGSILTFYIHGIVDSAIANVRTMAVFIIILSLFAIGYFRRK